MSDQTQSLAEALMAKHGVTEEQNGQHHDGQVPNPDADSQEAHEAGEDAQLNESFSSVDTSAATPSTANTSVTSNGKGKFDIESLDAFPTLGRGSSSAGTPAKANWGAGSTNGSGTNTPSRSPRPPIVSSSMAARSGAITESFTLLNSEQAPKARNILAEVLTKVRKTTSTSIDSSTTKATGNTTFIIKGLPDNVQKAKRDLLKSLAVKTTKTIQIPASLRSAVIGPKGSTLRPIIEESGTTIDIAKKENNDNEGDEFDDEKTVNVTIEGDKQAILLAEKRILEVVSSRVREITSRIQGVDKKFHPFIKQAIDQTPEEFKGININFGATNGSIALSGERNAVLEARAKLETIIANQKNTFSSSYEVVPEVKTKFVSPDLVFNASGVSVIVTPGAPTVELFGPTNKLASAKSVLSKHISDLAVLTLDISKAHDKSISHARNLTRYFISTNKLAELEKAHKNVQISTPSLESLYDQTPSAVIYEIVGNDGEAIKAAKKALVGVVNAYPPSSFKVVDDLDPFFYSHVSKAGKQIKQDKFVDVIVAGGKKAEIDALPSALRSEVLLAYTGNPKQDEEDFAPGVAEIQSILDQVSSEFDFIRTKQSDITSKTIEVPQENHKFITGPNNTTLNVILKGHSESEPFVSVVVGSSDGVTKNKNSVYVRGLKSEVDRVCKEIAQVIEESKNYEILSSYTTNFTFPVDHINKLIGKQGTHLSKLTEEFGVKIDVDEQGNGVIKGIKKNADEAKVRILNLGRKWADEVTIKLNIPNEHHATIIGSGGKFVKRLMQRYDVHIQFPRANASSPSPAGDEKDSKDAGRDRDGLTRDQVLIRGPSSGVAKTKEEIEELVKYEVDHSFSQTINVPANSLPRIIGRQGEFINEIKESTNTRIDVKDNDEADGAAVAKKDRSVPIEVIGTKTGVKSAIDKIQDIVQEFLDTVETEIEVDPKYHGALIGPGGAIRREIITKAGGSAESNRTIQIPPADSNSNKIKINGNRKVVDKIIKQIKEIVDARESQITDIIDVNPERHGALIGPGGLVKREIESTYNVTLVIPRKGAKKADGSIDEGIKIVGYNKEEIENVKARIKDLTQEAFQLEVEVPRHLHAELSNRGVYFRKLQQEFGVKVDHGKNSGSVPRAPSIPAPPSEAYGEASEAGDSGSVKYKFTIVPESVKAPTAESSTITWRLRGDDAGCAKAKEQIEHSIKELEKHDSLGYFWLADPTKYGSLIGPQGSRINSIRSKSGCTIVVPQSDSKNPIISLRGSAQQLEQAKDLIVKSLANKQ
ncbi:Scp160p [Sugiyamaella lignohabitans]|uniref:Scp160p n=1 Tax=Sugiyamaella lignohabitans TaxID=796027 RepID=A0A161HGZ5_9ASCO|nr:Scp160p [Sugiyamaella lignohabitans]ANB15120.1 Scp160p [Sugiyamaella lignohabitans]